DVVGRGENAAVAKRARAEFAGALEPADDPPGGKLVRDATEKLALAGQVRDRQSVLGGDAQELGRIDLRTPEGMVGHIEVRAAEMDPIGIERSAQRAAGVAPRAGDECPLESAFAR